jgi:regulator of nonsense transcripts 1
MSDYRIIVSTCASSCSYLMKSVEFKWVLIDEICQSIEPESLLPVSLGCQHLVLIGDHKQLGPIISDKAI